MNTILTLTEWLNLLSAMQIIIDRYGLDAIIEAVEHFKNIRND